MILHTSLLLAVLTLAPAIAVEPEKVDFTLPPAKGLSMKIGERVEAKLEGTAEANGNEMKIMAPVEFAEKFEHRVVEIADDRVKVIERTYEESAIGGGSTPVAWKRIRVERTEEGAKFLVRDDDEWKAAGDAVRAMFTPDAALQPILPIPNKSLEVGQSWELDEATIKRFFAPARYGSEAEHFGGAGTYRFSTIEQKDERAIAVLDLELTVESDEESAGSELKLKGQMRYDVAHRVIVGVKLAGTMAQTRTIPGLGEVELSGPVKIGYTVKVTPPDA